MLNILRKKAQSTFIQALVIIIALVFVFWGVGSGFGNKRNLVATVNKEEITLQEFQKAYDNMVEAYRQQFNGTIPDGLLEGLGIKQQVLSQLIQAALLRQGAEAMGITVSKLATQEKIKAMPAFQKNGKFDMERYTAILAQNHLTPSSFEADIQNELLTEAVINSIKRFIDVTDFEVASRLAQRLEEIKLDYVLFKGEQFKEKVEVDDTKLTAYFEKHKNNYLTEPRVKLKYITFPLDDKLETITVDPQEVEGLYNRQKERYNIPEKRRARHILFALQDKNNELDRKLQREKAEKVLQLAKKGEDFAELAKKYSEGPSAPRGGDLGFFARGDMVAPFDEAVFSLKPGEISDIVETSFGFHIIKLEAVQPAIKRTLDDVRKELETQLKKQQARKAVFAEANDVYEAIIKAGSIDSYAKSGNRKVITTDFFTKNSPPKDLPAGSAFLRNAFSLKKGELSSVFETDQGYAIIYVDDIEEPKVPEFATVRDRVLTDYTKAESIKLAQKAAQELLESAKKKGDLATAAKEKGVELKSTGFIRQDNGAAVSKLPPQVIKKGFELSTKNPFPEAVESRGDSFYVFQLVARRQPEVKDDEQEKEQIRNQLLTDKQNRLLNNWLAHMQSRSKIWINQQLLQ